MKPVFVKTKFDYIYTDEIQSAEFSTNQHNRLNLKSQGAPKHMKNIKKLNQAGFQSKKSVDTNSILP